jgi:cytochrome c oxidase assembly protein subunit 15
VDPITRWLFMVAALVVAMVLVGGFVRLSRAGLSIVEWDVVTGILPPIGDAAWEQSFAEYQQTPEYRLVNSGMSLGDYQHIFYIEWAHRLIARIVGLLVVLPLVWFVRKGFLSVRASLRYWGVAALFGAQGLMGWLMVSSGLRDRPAVSHFRLTIHLLAALALLGIVLWMALDRLRSERSADAGEIPTHRSTGRTLSCVLLGSVVAQIAYGGIVAGLKAGYVSDTWPLMFGRFIPRDLLTTYEPGWTGLFEPVGSHWVHRWFAFLVAAVAVAVFITVRREHAGSSALRVATKLLLFVIVVQIALGIGVVVLGVPKWLALAHQGTGVALFCISIVIAHGVGAKLGLRAVGAENPAGGV